MYSLEVLCMTFNRIHILRRSFPLMASELADAILLLTGVLYMGFQDELQLAATGLIDAFLLCSMAAGHALTESIQQFYVRRSQGGKKTNHQGEVFVRSVRWFTGVGIVVLGFCFLLVASGNLLTSSPVWSVFIDALPFFAVFVLLYYFGLSMHAYLVGNGHLRTVGWISFTGVLVHALLLYLLLYRVNPGLSPSSTVLLSAIVSQLVWITLLFLACRRRGAFQVRGLSPRRYGLLLKTLLRMSFIPGSSQLVFHLGISAFFAYAADCCASSDLGLFTMGMAYWNVLNAPANGVMESAINSFSGLHSMRRHAAFKMARRRHLQVAFGSAIALLTLLSIIAVGSDIANHESILLLGMIGLGSLISIRNKFGFTALLTRLDNLAILHVKMLLLALTACGILVLDQWIGLRAMPVLFVVLGTQITAAFWLSKKVHSTWVIGPVQSRLARNTTL